MADLKALIEQKGYQEAIDHLKDISPSERKAEWIDIAGTAGAGIVTGAPDAETKLGRQRFALAQANKAATGDVATRCTK